MQISSQHILHLLQTQTENCEYNKAFIYCIFPQAKQKCKMNCLELLGTSWNLLWFQLSRILAKWQSAGAAPRPNQDRRSHRFWTCTAHAQQNSKIVPSLSSIHPVQVPPVLLTQLVSYNVQVGIASARGEAVRSAWRWQSEDGSDVLNLKKNEWTHIDTCMSQLVDW